MIVTIEFNLKNSHTSKSEKLKIRTNKALLDRAKYGFPIAKEYALQKIQNLVIAYADFKWDAVDEYDTIEITSVDSDTGIHIDKAEFKKIAKKY